VKQERSIVRTPSAPAAVGPYSQGVQAGGFVFTSGQIPLDPATGKLVEGPIEEQTRRVMENLAAVLTSAGTSLERVVKTTIYLVNLADFAAVNRVYGGYFSADPPARSTVQVAALPLGAIIEIEAVALAATSDNTTGH
jgi:2-iminobutanoate/2-iminopropanoate deaminase